MSQTLEAELNRLFASGTVTVDASVKEVFALVSDPVAMAEMGEEIASVRWLDGARGAAVGARFEGLNRNGLRRWRTVCRIIALEESPDACRFAYDVDVPVFGVPIARWEYVVTPEGDGCTVTETNWARVPLWFVPAAILITGVFHRRDHNQGNIAATLAHLKARAEPRSKA